MIDSLRDWRILGRLRFALTRRNTLDDRGRIRADKIRDRETLTRHSSRAFKPIGKRGQRHSMVGGFKLVCSCGQLQFKSG